MPAEALPSASTASFHIQRSLRHCLSSMAELLYESGHVLETITLPQRGLSRQELDALRHQHPRWALCQKTLEESDAAMLNDSQPDKWKDTPGATLPQNLNEETYVLESSSVKSEDEPQESVAKDNDPPATPDGSSDQDSTDSMPLDLSQGLGSGPGLALVDDLNTDLGPMGVIPNNLSRPSQLRNPGPRATPSNSRPPPVQERDRPTVESKLPIGGEPWLTFGEIILLTMAFLTGCGTVFGVYTHVHGTPLVLSEYLKIGNTTLHQDSEKHPNTPPAPPAIPSND